MTIERVQGPHTYHQKFDGYRMHTRAGFKPCTEVFEPSAMEDDLASEYLLYEALARLRTNQTWRLPLVRSPKV